jgi:lysyl-tRNA synthetase class 1
MPETVRNTLQGAAPKAWPFDEARKVAARLAATGKESALFETGYGPSGLPHIGTFGEVARTSWVRHAFGVLTGQESRLLAFSDDMDALRKVPDNVPNPEMLRAHLGQPLTRIPDPFGEYPSFGAYNNAMLERFLTQFDFDYEFASSTEYYASGKFDAALLRVLQCHDAIVAAVLPTLGPERAATYSPILPIHPATGQVMQVRIEHADAVAGTVTWRDPRSGDEHVAKVTGGRAKLQWKADWAMRWHALGVDYEMSGKDLIDSVKLSSTICRILGSAPPDGMTYELFLDEHGQKISKSRGNGLSVDEWLAYAPPESLSQFMYNQPQRAKRLFFDVIPRAVDEYIGNVEKAQVQADPERMQNPAWHIHAGRVPDGALTPISFAMLQNLAATVGATSPDVLWGFVRRYAPEATPESAPFLARLIEHAVAYSQGFLLKTRHLREPTASERDALADLAACLAALPPGTPGEDVQTVVYEVGKRHYQQAELRAWFGCLYQVLLGQSEGPRFGQFAALYGIAETVRLIEARLRATAAQEAA